MPKPAPSAGSSEIRPAPKTIRGRHATPNDPISATPGAVVCRLLVRRGRLGVKVRLVQHEPCRVVGGLEHIEPKAARLVHSAHVVRPGGLDEIGHVLREHVDMDQRDVHARDLLVGG